SIGQMLAVFSYLWFMIGPVEQLLSLQYAFYAAGGALARINQLLARADEPRHAGGQDPFSGRRTVGIEVRGLSFTYRDEPVLDGLDLTIAPGEKVAIVGASGGGKSTLVQLLLGLYQPQAGVIRFGGASLEEIGLERVREQVAVVLQHPALFNDTVRANLCMGRERGDAECWRALEIAQLADTVRQLPQQLDSVVGRSGVRLSGGQRQRLAIARMVLADPRVVILDEATSALDAATEFALHQALGRFLDGRTTLIIAHRLSAVKQADRVLVFDGGRIAEEGDHQRLIDEGGLYARLYGHLQH
ncbi:MAG TPA: ABC transporter ATP-binding protein, partial [Pseudomonas sp.]|nr:ABC transporter ATP-binding protein [Pseudomonas sp.]